MASAMRGLLDYLIALPCSLLPRRYWDSLDLPVANVSMASAFIVMFAGFGIGIPGFFLFLARLQGIQGLSILDVATAQVEGRAAETAAVSMAPQGFYMLAPLTYAFFTPLGLFSMYLILSSFFRIATAWVDDPHGDPLMTLIDSLTRKRVTQQQQKSARVQREKLERADEPDRRYDGEWAGLKDVDFVIVAARRKPGWTKGTWVTTNDGWFVLGEPFDRPMANGLRTVYPLTMQNTLEVVRRSVEYELPPLRETKRIVKNL